jgi:cytochrome c-type biogenesis protein CcmH
MIQYWIPLALLTVVAMLFVLIPLWRLRKRESARALHVREEKNREIFAGRQQELEQEVREGTIAAEDYQRLIAELQRAFLTDMQGLQTLQSAQPQRQNTLLWVPLVLALLIPVAAVLLYRSKGSVPDLQLPALMQQVRVAEDKDGQIAALDKLTVFLAERLERRPKDMQNGYMLGTLYLELDRPQEAIPVFRKMLANMKPGPDRATVLGQLAQAMFLQDNKNTLAGTQADPQQLPTLSISPETRAAMEEALTLNPNEQLVMGIYAIDAYFKRDFVVALKYWRRQLSDLQPGSAEAGQLRQRIATIEANLPEDQKVAAQGPRITVVIDMAPELAAKLGPDMRLFVYARNPAIPMPIVAQNLAVPSFPFTLMLDNTMSMTGMQLESAPQLVVGARLSSSGTAIAKSGDLETLSAPFVLKDQSGPLTLTINRIVP